MSARRRWAPTIVGGLFLSTLVGMLIVYDHVVLEAGPEALIGRAVGEPCSDSEQCRAALGSATRRAVPKVCVAAPGRLEGVCALACGESGACPDGSRCAESRTLVGGAIGAIPARACTHDDAQAAR